MPNVCKPLVTRKRIGPRVVAAVDATKSTTGGYSATQKYRVTGLRSCFSVGLFVGFVHPTRPSRQYDSNSFFNQAANAAASNPAPPVIVTGVYPYIGTDDNTISRLKNPFMGGSYNVNEIAQDLPFSWEFSTLADEVEIDIQVLGQTTYWIIAASANGISGAPYSGQVNLWAVIEYVGPSTDPDYVKTLLDGVSLSDLPTLIVPFLGVP